MAAFDPRVILIHKKKICLINVFHNLNGLKQHSASKRQNLTAGKVNRIECRAGTTNFIFSIDLVS